MASSGLAETVAVAIGLGWEDCGQNKKGYTRLKCPCGRHMHWLHKTPSNPKYW